MVEDTLSARVLEMLSDTMEALSAGRSGDQTVCDHLSQAVGAHSAVTLAIDPGAPIHPVAVYPSAAEAEALRDFVMSTDPRAQMDHVRSHEHPLLGHIVTVSVRPAPSAIEFRDYARVLAFAKHAPFGMEDRYMLEKSCRPLASLWPHAARAAAAAAQAPKPKVLLDEHLMTSRELEVLGLLSEGLLATSIASRLSLSPRTVHKHLGNIYRKLGVHDRLVAVSLARMQGLVDEAAHPVSPSSPSSAMMH
ncbi:MAG: helix-turn-helix transcriptional regulator [Micropruina sp.]